VVLAGAWLAFQAFGPDTTAACPNQASDATCYRHREPTLDHVRPNKSSRLDFPGRWLDFAYKGQKPSSQTTLAPQAEGISEETRKYLVLTNATIPLKISQLIMPKTRP